MIDFNNKGFFKLKQNDDYASMVSALLIPGEEVVDSYKSLRDGVVFTNKRLISVNVQGVTGKKKDYSSIPYENITMFSVETGGTFDLDSELTICIAGLGTVKFEFKSKSKITEISKYIATAKFS